MLIAFLTVIFTQLHYEERDFIHKSLPPVLQKPTLNVTNYLLIDKFLDDKYNFWYDYTVLKPRQSTFQCEISGHDQYFVMHLPSYNGILDKIRLDRKMTFPNGTIFANVRVQQSEIVEINFLSRKKWLWNPFRVSRIGGQLLESGPISNCLNCHEKADDYIFSFNPFEDGKVRIEFEFIIEGGNNED